MSIHFCTDGSFFDSSTGYDSAWRRRQLEAQDVQAFGKAACFASLHLALFVAMRAELLRVAK